MFHDRSRPEAQPVLNKEGLFLFMPMLGKGIFGSHSLARIWSHNKNLHIETSRVLNQQEKHRFAKAYADNMFYWMLISLPPHQGDSGAVCMHIPYSESSTLGYIDTGRSCVTNAMDPGVRV